MVADEERAEESGTAFEFMSDWRTFAPIAFTNLLLSIVTLGIYLFWARARERRFLWSQTRLIDDRLEWTGTGLELFIGYVIAMVVFVIPLGGLQFLIQALSIRGHGGAAGLLILLLYFALIYLSGVAIFRALRYRLSRTLWHGIRGGSEVAGWRYGIEHVWRTIVGSMLLGLLVPWSMVSLWNARWNKMSFGPTMFESSARYEPVFKRYLLFYLVPIIFSVIIVAFIVVGILSGALNLHSGRPPDSATFVIYGSIFYLLFFVVLGAVAIIFYSAYFREVVGRLSLGDLSFAFTARTRDWLMLVLGNFALVIFTLGIGTIFLGYRNWTFFVRHMEVYGEVRLDLLTQSTTRAPGQGEGLIDAFDIGAF